MVPRGEMLLPCGVHMMQIRAVENPRMIKIMGTRKDRRRTRGCFSVEPLGVRRTISGIAMAAIMEQSKKHAKTMTSESRILAMRR